MEFVDNAGTRYQLTESAEAPEPTKKPVVWPWVVGGLALVGGLVWMASSASRKHNPVAPEVEALIAEARDPETSFERLHELNRSGEEVRRALLDNPKIWEKMPNGKLNSFLLDNLARDFPDDFAQTPQFVLHGLVEPDVNLLWIFKAVVEKSKDANLIDHLLVTYRDSWELRLNVAKNPHSPDHVLRLLGIDSTEHDPTIRSEVSRNPSTPEDVLRTMGNQVNEDNIQIRANVAMHPNVPEDVLRVLGDQKTESDNYVRAAVAANTKTPEDVLRVLGNSATEPDAWVRTTVAANTKTPEDVLRVLGNSATEPNAWVRRMVAKNPRTPRAILVNLSKEKTEADKNVRDIAKNELKKRGI